MTSTSRDQSTAQPRSPGPYKALLAVLALAAGTRIAYALTKSLVLDEFHSYYHATAASWGGLMEGLLQDNHPPLSFLVIGAAGSALGWAEWALRTPALLFGLLEIALIASMAGHLARRAGGDGARWRHASVWAAALLAASSLHFDYGTQARMYVFLSLLVTIVTYALITFLEKDTGERASDDPTGLWGAIAAFTLAATAGFYTHYFMVQYTVLLSAVFLVVAWSTQKRRALRAFATAALPTGMLSMPWALTGFRHQLIHALPPGGDDASLSGLAQAFVQLFFHNIRFGGSIGRLAFVAGAALVLLVAVRGFVDGLGRKELRAPALLLGASGFALPVIAWALAAVLPRAGFTWHYVLPSAGAVAVLFGLGARGRWAQVASGTALALASVLVGLHLMHPATEDFRGAVAFAIEAAESAPDDEVTRIVSVEWQPALFPQGQPYDYYAPRLAGDGAPLREPMLEGEFTVQSLERLQSADRVIVVRRSLPNDQHLLRELTKVFPHVEVTPFGFGVDVREFTR